MARTTPMRLVELMVLKQDVSSVIEFLGKKGNFQFQTKHSSSASDSESSSKANPDGDIFLKLQQAKTFLNADVLSISLLMQIFTPMRPDRLLTMPRPQ